VAEHRRSFPCKVAVVALASAVALGVAGIDVTAARAMTAPPPVGKFVTKCTLSHERADDPIVKPNQPGASHLHDFFGNTTTNAATSLRSLNSGGTTCANPKDLSAYWVPALRVRGKPVRPMLATVYYLNAGKHPRTIKSIPPGLRVVAGDMMATAPQPQKVVNWDCGFYGSPPRTTPPPCHNGHLELNVNFPDCWNGRDLDSPDHKSHLAYHLQDRSCPAAYPVPIPGVRVIVRYQTAGGPDVTLASGPPFTAHADFFNAWVPAELNRLVKTCIQTARRCNPQGEVVSG
jgi:hypothetical protein